MQARQLTLLAVAALMTFAIDGHAGQVTFASGKITFQPPEGFVALTREEIGRKYPATNPPEQVFAIERQGVSIAFDVLPMAFPPGPLAASLKQVAAGIGQSAPGMVWLKQEVVTFSGRSWMHLEFTHQAIDQRIHNHIYLTNFEGKILRFGMNSTVALYGKYQAALEKSRDTLRIAGR
jgi:hypothetical protein